MHQTTGDPALGDLARTWVATTLDLGAQSLPDAGFLTGAAGVGLALLAATGDREPTWDRFLLLSAPELSPRRQTGAAPEEEDAQRATGREGTR